MLFEAALRQVLVHPRYLSLYRQAQGVLVLFEAVLLQAVFSCSSSVSVSSKSVVLGVFFTVFEFV